MIKRKKKLRWYLPFRRGRFLPSLRLSLATSWAGFSFSSLPESPGGRGRQHISPCCLLVPSGLPAPDRPACISSLSVSLLNARHRLCSSGQLFVHSAYYFYIPRMSPCRSGVSASDSLPASLPFSPVSRRCQLPLPFSPPPFWWTARLCTACCTPGRLSAWLPLCFIGWRWGENRWRKRVLASTLMASL